MAIAGVKKIRILAHLQHRLAVMKTLQTMGLLELKEITPEVIELPEEREGGSEQTTLEPYKGKEIREVEEDLSRVSHALELLKRYGSPPTIPTLSGPPTLSESEFEQLGKNYDFRVLVDRCHKLEKELKQIYSREAHLTGQIEAFAPWGDLDSSMESMDSNTHVTVTAGIVPITHYKELLEALGGEESSELVETETVQRGDKEVSLVVIAHKEVAEATSELLAEHNFREIRLPRSSKTPSEATAAYEKELIELGSRKEKIKGEFSELAGGPLSDDSLEKLSEPIPWLEFIETVGGYITLQAVADYLRNRLSRREALGYLWRSRETIIVEGWINGRFEGRVKEKLERIAPEIDVNFEDPSEDETVPSILDNRPTISPFEVLTDMYGSPHRAEFDPTPVMAPFFFICFGFCVTDAGYGAVLTIMMLLALKKLKLSRGVRQFFRLMLFGGISTVILGALTGGWFGDIFQQIAEANPDSTVLGLPFRAADSITLLDPVQQIIYFLGIALFVGLIQLTTGVVVKAVHNISQGRPWAAVIDQLSWIMFVWGVIAYVPVSRLFPGKEFIPVGMILGGMGLVVIGPALVQLFNWQGLRSFALSFGGGLWSLYGMATGMMADVLSYSRLFALGLATGILATVIDILAVMIWGMAPVIGWLLAIVILVVGHVFNLLVQLLGAFIHSARLQFVEFFPKFFEGGGSPFKPFSRTLKNIYIQPEVNQES